MMRVLLVILIQVLLCGRISSQESLPLEHAISVNPIGFVWQGIAYVEYERMVNNSMSVVGRVDYFQYDYEESESRYTYTEEGSGFGVGGGIRLYSKGNGELKGFYGGAFVDVVNVDWEWEEDDNGREDFGSGETWSFSLLFQIGYKISLGNRIFIDPSIYGGYLSTDQSLDIGFVASPSLALGVRL